MRAERVLRWTGLLAWAATSLEAMSAAPWEPRALIAVGVVGLGFGASFLWVTGPGLRGGRPRALAANLVWQTALGLTMAFDLAYIVALTLPFCYRRRIGVLWLAARNAIAVPVLIWLAIAQQVEAHREVSVWLTASTVALHLAWQVLAFAVGLVVVAERAGRVELARVNAELHAAQQQLGQRARLDERLELARELHDSIGHHLAALNVQLELARHLATDAARPPIEQAHAAGRRLLGEVRDVVSAWRDDAALDLVGELDGLARAIAEPEVIVDVADDVDVRDPAIAHAMFRCAQEAVTNAVRHAGAAHVWIEVAARAAGLALVVRDDGRGQAQVHEGNGLRGIAERAAALGGSSRTSSAPGRGFTVELWLPAARAA